MDNIYSTASSGGPLRFPISKSAPEHSVILRIIVAITVMISILALAREELWPDWWPWVIALTAFGFWVSWVRREKKNWWIRGILAISMVVVGIQGISDILNAPFDPRVALANLLMELQVIHSFDMPGRKDLNYSILVSLILMALAGVLSNDFVFGLFFIPYLVCVVLSLFAVAYREGEDRAAGTASAASVFPFARVLGTFLLMIFLGTSVFFLFFPRMEGFALHFVPMTRKLFVSGFRFFHGNVSNPGYPMSAGSGGGALRQRFRHFNPDSYFGFNPYLDLSQRGELSSLVVLKVKTRIPGYWRGLAFDHYTGDGWSISEQSPTSLTLYDYNVHLHPFEMPALHYKQVPQTFFVSNRLPNLLFSMYQPASIYFPSSTLYQDSDEGIRIPFYLEPGTVYTVISQVPENGEEVMRNSSWDYPKAIVSRYLQLPAQTPARVRDLALDIAKNETTPYGKMSAILRWLHQFPYSLDIPPPPEGRDAVDHFLFDLKKGYCEQFASALAVLGREVQIPTRLVTGYATGTYNPFTMNYEVREKDAHAWVEVYFSNAGWVPLDASPTFSEFPFSPDKTNSEMGIFAVAGYLKSWLMLHFPSLSLPSLDGLGSYSKGIIPEMAWLSGFLGFLGIIILAFRKFFHRFGDAKESEPLSRLQALYRKLEKKLTHHGYIRNSWETPLEFAERLPAGELQAKVQEFTRHYIRVRFASRSVEEKGLAEAEDLLNSMALLKTSKV